MTVKKLYEIYHQDVYRYLFSLTKDVSLAEDLLSETFLGATRSLPKFRGEADLQTWLFSIARRKWIDHLRKEKITYSEEELTGRYFSVPGDPENILLQRETIRRIRELLNAELPRQREVVLMRIEGYSVSETARKLGLSESSVRVIDHRVRKKIRDTLLKEGFTGE